ncbi:MAG TPA: hypothetical protein PL084_13665 [Chitinophagales bacterium]|nr:hypothetical protein [Chitinophagales bacterium]HRP39714.1 hypothetical protein [Chitinophagales bacterium]
MRTRLKFTIYTLVCFFISACCKHKSENVCNPTPFSIQPFVEKRHIFQCNNSDEFTYIFRKKKQIDSLSPTCFFIGSVAFPTEDTNMVYLMIGRTSSHYKDTISIAQLLIDTCNKHLIYNISMVQTDTTLNTFPGRRTIFCSVENIPADYQVEVKYKYVPLPE